VALIGIYPQFFKPVPTPTPTATQPTLFIPAAPTAVSFVILDSPAPQIIPQVPTATLTVSPTLEAFVLSTPTFAKAAFPTSTITQLAKFDDPHPAPDDYIDSRGVPMRLVPAGSFTMGASADSGFKFCGNYESDCQLSWFKDEEPPHPVDLPAFYLDKFEVTNVFYAACVSVGMCPLPTNISHYSDPDYAKHPVVYVAWEMAKKYCLWRGAQLPSEAQWEKAARGNDGRTFPWGSDLDCNKANYFTFGFPGKCVGDTTPLGNYPDGQSVYGIYDLAGNVGEWVADWHDVYPDGDPNASPGFGQKYHVQRGGSWYLGENYARSTNRYYDDTGSSELYGNKDLGFRCARPVNP
jgi:formylglycine-generating enzyme required for sulfatase activity